MNRFLIFRAARAIRFDGATIQEDDYLPVLENTKLVFYTLDRAIDKAEECAKSNPHYQYYVLEVKSCSVVGEPNTTVYK